MSSLLFMGFMWVSENYIHIYENRPLSSDPPRNWVGFSSVKPPLRIRQDEVDPLSEPHEVHASVRNRLECLYVFVPLLGDAVRKAFAGLVPRQPVRDLDPPFAVRPPDFPQMLRRRNDELGRYPLDERQGFLERPVFAPCVELLQHRPPSQRSGDLPRQSTRASKHLIATPSDLWV